MEGERGVPVVAAAGSFALFLGISVAAIDSLARVDLLAHVWSAGVVATEGRWVRCLVAAAGSLALGLCLGEAAVSTLARVDGALRWAWRAW